MELLHYRTAYESRHKFVFVVIVLVVVVAVSVPGLVVSSSYLTHIT